MAHCKIYLENYTGVYYAGAEVRGRVECFFNSETTLRGVKIRMKCKEHNEWVDNESYYDTHESKYKTRYVTFTGDNCVLFLEQMLFGSEHESHSLQPGKHVFPFNFTLPETLPSSFNGPYGSIFYRLKAIVDRPMRTDYEDTFVIKIQAPVDFNLKPESLQEAATYSDEKTVCCWCCKGGNITMDVEVPKTAFVPGETVDFKVIVTNLSNESVQELQVKLLKTITFKVNYPSSKSRDEVEEIVNFTQHGVGAHGEHIYDLQLHIPEHIEVPNFALCNLFESSYRMEVTCGMPTCSMDLEVNLYPELGHIQRGGSNQYYDEKGSSEPYPPSNGSYPPPPSAYPPPAGVYPPPGGSPYPPSPGSAYPPPAGGAYPPPAGGAYPPPAGGAYPPPAGGAYPPAGGTYPPAGSVYPPAGGAYPPAGGVYPTVGGAYPPAAGAYLPPAPAGGDYPPSYGASSEKPVYPSGMPTAPFGTNANAPPGDAKAREASGAPTAPTETPPEMPPPSYNQIQPPYPPKN